MRTLGWTLMALCLGVAQFSPVAWAEEWPPTSYSAKEITATVVDDRNGQPLDGVIVVAQWVLYVAAVGHGDHGPRLNVAETVSDAAGRFSFSAWGPKPNPRYPFTKLINRDPLLSIFKAGYGPLILQNRWAGNEAVRESEWNSKTIRLKRFIETNREWAKVVTRFQHRLGWSEDMIDWRWMPRMVLALELERLELQRKRVYVPGFTPSPLERLGTTAEQVRLFLERGK